MQEHKNPYNFKNSNDVPGFTSTLQHQYYKKLVQQLPQSPKVLEIGCAFGRSTWAWLDFLPLTSEFYILDTFENNNVWLPDQADGIQIPADANNFVKSAFKDGYSHYEIFNYIIAQHKNFSIIKKIIKNTYHDAKVYLKNLNFDLVYLDGDHNYFEVLDQLLFFDNIPILCGDDSAIDSVRKALFEYGKQKQKEYTIIPKINMWKIINE
tara:strand:+ start:60 stop:686 length:627 start_codon:yes stop_codon:yes gene_type:complete